MLARSADLCDLSKLQQDVTKLTDQSIVINRNQLAKRLQVGAKEINPTSFLVEVTFDCVNHPLSDQKHTIAPCDAYNRKLGCVCFKWKLPAEFDPHQPQTSMRRSAGWIQPALV